MSYSMNYIMAVNVTKWRKVEGSEIEVEVDE
jgi:hypothetical protein